MIAQSTELKNVNQNIDMDQKMLWEYHKR
jgi:hypothetical protein